MRTLGAFVVLGVVGAAPVALAEAWRAKPALEVGSPLACKEADVSNLFFDLADADNELSVKTSNDVRATGRCEEPFRRPYRECENAGDESTQ